MTKKIVNINGVRALSKKEQQLVKGGDFPFFDECCVCIFTPAGSPFPVLITQPCSQPCPTDGSVGHKETGC